MKLLNEFYLSPNYVTEINVNDDGEYVYTFDYNGLINNITLIDNDLGSGYIAKQDNITSELIKNENGQVYLNGNPIEIKSSLASTKEYSEYLEMRGKVDSYTTESCPAGTKARDYSELYDTFTEDRIALKERISNVAFATFYGIFVGALTYVSGGTAAALASGISSLVLGIYNEIQLDNPYCEYLSFTDKVYITEDGPAISLTKSAWKHKVKVYDDKNHTGNVYNETFYEVREYNI